MAGFADWFRILATALDGRDVVYAALAYLLARPQPVGVSVKRSWRSTAGSAR